MKNKLITLITAAVLMITVAFAQDVKLTDTPSTVSIKPVAVRNIHDNHDWRTGLAFEVLNFRDGQRIGYPTFATADVWVLSDAADFKSLFLGAGVDFPLFHSKHLSAGVTFGYSADFADLERIRRSAWSIGLSASFRF
jgi:hypothetical protein